MRITRFVIQITIEQVQSRCIDFQERFRGAGLKTDQIQFDTVNCNMQMY